MIKPKEHDDKQDMESNKKFIGLVMLVGVLWFCVIVMVAYLFLK